jgi:hypothetical protein
MNDTEILIPSEGLVVRDPISMELLPITGEVKPLIGPEGRYWRRRLRDGSVIIAPSVTTKQESIGRRKITNDPV